MERKSKRLTPKDYKLLNNTRRTFFRKLKREAKSLEASLLELNEGAKTSVFKCLDGENKGRWICHIINENGVTLE